MRRRTRWIAVGAVSVAALGAGTGIAVAGGGDDTEAPIPATEIDKASAAALDSTGGGTVTDTEVGDEEGYYEVEVKLDDGSSVDVHLDRDFNVISSEADGAGEDESGPDAD
jgi:hypothetical protein